MSTTWTTLITAASTLIAGWGGISFKDWLDSRRAKKESRHAAYLELMLCLDGLRRVFGAPDTLGEKVVSGKIGEAMGQAVGSIQQAYFALFLVASPPVQQAAGQAQQAAWAVYDWFDGSGRTDVETFRRLLTALQAKSMAFADVVHAEEVGRPQKPLFEL